MQYCSVLYILNLIKNLKPILSTTWNTYREYKYVILNCKLNIFLSSSLGGHSVLTSLVLTPDRTPLRVRWYGWDGYWKKKCLLLTIFEFATSLDVISCNVTITFQKKKKKNNGNLIVCILLFVIIVIRK